MPEKTKQPVTFESAVERLEQIVELMEGDQLPLEEMLERYEEGTQLVKYCSEKLSSAQKRIEIVARNAAGEPQISEFDPASASTLPAQGASKETSKRASADDVSLF